MKLNRTHIFIAFSSTALVALLFLQVSWLFRTAKIKEELFNEKANMVLSRTVQDLCADKETCSRMGSCCIEKEGEGCTMRLGKQEAAKIDSLLQFYMKFYNFHLDYSFEVTESPALATIAGDGNPKNIFRKRLEEMASHHGMELHLIFPDKKQFILAEMGGMFITSVLLIVVVLLLFWQTLRSLMREKKISENTTEFLNNMTHEFKTPLTNIALAGKMLRKDMGRLPQERLMHYSGIILEENEKLRQQVERVLSMTALERGEIPVSGKPLDLHELLHKAVNCISVQVESRNGKLRMDLNAEENKVCGDREHLINAVCNLVDNAIKYCRREPEISISTLNRDKELVLSITDNGIGISKDHHSNVFNKYFRVPSGDTHDVKGFGLGLAYVKKIVELHKGQIQLESEINCGTTFTITLPLANAGG